MTHNRKYRLDKNVMPIECRRACVQHTMHAPKLYREPKNGFIEFIGALNVGKKTKQAINMNIKSKNERTKESWMKVKKRISSESWILRRNSQ